MVDGMDSEQKTSNGKVTLRMWPGYCGLPSADVDSLILLTFCKIHNVDVEPEYVNIPQFKPVPSIICNGYTATNADIPFVSMAVIKEMLNLEYDDKKYPDEVHIIKTYSQYIREELGLLLFLTQWVDDYNFERVTKPFFKKAIRFPFNHFYIRNMRNLAKEKVSILQGGLDFDEYIKRQTDRAILCLYDLAAFLGEKEFFMGLEPCSLDAYAYAYLAMFDKMPFINSSFKIKLSNVQILQDYLRNMNKTVFPGPRMYQIKRQRSVEGVDGPPMWQIVVAGVTAAAMLYMYTKFHRINLKF